MGASEVADPPRQSPKPDVDRPGELDDEPKTDPKMYVQAEYVWGYADKVREKIEADASRHERKLRHGGWLMTVVGTVAATGITIAVFVIFIDNRVRAETDAGVQVHEMRLSTLEQQRRGDREEVNSRLQRLEANQNADHELQLGTSRKLDAMLDRFDVRNPAPTPKDGGR